MASLTDRLTSVETNISGQRRPMAGMISFYTRATAVFRALSVRPDDFFSRSSEKAFGSLIDGPHDDDAAKAWSCYLHERYLFLAQAD